MLTNCKEEKLKIEIFKTRIKCNVTCINKKWFNAEMLKARTVFKMIELERIDCVMNNGNF